MRIGVVTPWSIDDGSAWSGVVKPMVAALSTVGEVVPFITKDVPDALPDRALARLLDGRLGRRYLVGHALATGWRRGQALKGRLERDPVDVIITIAASQDIAFLDTEIPIIQVSDTSFAAIKNFYPLFTNLNPLSSTQAHIQAALSSRRASHTLAATQWAKEALTRDDGIPAAQITVAPFGPATRPVARQLTRKEGPLRLLMISSDWERKGGPEVIKVGDELRRRGIDFEMTVVGATPPLPDWVRVTGKIPREELALEYASADVLLDLAKSNAAGVVLTDAASFGIPVVATDTGGVSSIVLDGVTGFLVPPGDITRIADRVEALTALDVRDRMRHAAIRRARDVLNWEAWAAAASAAADKVMSAETTNSTPAIVSFSPAIPYPGIEHAGGQYLRRLQDALVGTSRVTWVTQDRPSVRHAFKQPGVATDVLILGDQQDAPVWRRRAYSLADKLETLIRKADSQPIPLGVVIDLITRKDVRHAVRAADVLDFQWAAWTRLAPVVRRWNPKATLNFTFHDVMSQKCDREASRAPDPLRRLKWRLAARLARRWEQRAVSMADSAIVFSEKDRTLLDPGHAHSVVVVHPPLADGPMPIHTPADTNRVLLVGYMARAENVEAFLWFAREIWPRIRAQVPNAQLHVVGGSMPVQLSEQFRDNTDGIVLRGFVDDLEAEYAAANAVVVPLLHGAGVKFKTIEALLSGVPVVTTPIGAEGIGGPELFQGYTTAPEDFASCVVAALTSDPGSQQPTPNQQEILWKKHSTSNFTKLILSTYKKPGASHQPT